MPAPRRDKYLRAFLPSFTGHKRRNSPLPIAKAMRDVIAETVIYPESVAFFPPFLLDICLFYLAWKSLIPPRERGRNCAEKSVNRFILASYSNFYSTYELNGRFLKKKCIYSKSIWEIDFLGFVRIWLKILQIIIISNWLDLTWRNVLFFKIIPFHRRII